MYLVYLDESGNTGNDLESVQQPIFVLAALLVHNTKWQAVERDLETALTKHLPEHAATGREIHATDLRNGRGMFDGIPVPRRLALRDAWLDIVADHGLTLVYRSIIKRQYREWLDNTLPAGVAINPHVAAFGLLVSVVNRFLADAATTGILISDETAENDRDIDTAIRQLRATVGPIQLTNIIERGFYIDSSTSRFLQLCDVCAFYARKLEEHRAGGALKPNDRVGVEKIERITVRRNEPWRDVLAWLIEERKKRSGQGA